MLATINTVHDPFNPLTSREVFSITAPKRIRDLAPITDKPFVCLRDGNAVMRADWDDYVCDGEVIAFVTLPQGGNNGASQAVAVILQIVLYVVAPYAAGYISTSYYGYLAAQAAIIVAGSMLINALVPPPKPPSTESLPGLASPSPTYSLQAQGNYARLESAIPVQYGRVKLFPDFGAQPYAEFQGNDQYLYQLFVIGQGEYDIESINIEDSPITSWEDITYEVIQPYGTLTLFPANVITSGEVSGQELTDAGYTGPFIANASGTDANYIGIDIILSRGLYQYDTGTGAILSDTLDFTIEAQEVDDAGATVGGWVTLDTVTITAATTTPQRYTYRYSVTPARYQVRIKRNDAKQTGSNFGNDLLWGGLRAYLPDVRDFGNVTLLAMRMRASNNLSLQASRKINVIATRKLLTWHPDTGWAAATTATRNIAWAIADILKNTVYGAKLADARIGLAQLYTLSLTWEARGDHFDGRFDNSLTLWEALTQVAQAGRAKPYMQGGIVFVSRDDERTTPVALFSMRNIVKGSFSVDYILPTEDTADAVEATYTDASVWAQQRVTAYMPGSGALNPAKITLFGVTDRNHAYREAMYHVASNTYRRRMIKFTTEMEGFIPSFGDLVAVQHDMVQWGQFGEATAWNSGTRMLTLSEPLTFGVGSHYVGIRAKDGSVNGPYLVTAGASPNQIVFAAGPSITVYTGDEYERSHIVFGAGETWRQIAKVTAVRPAGLYQVAIEAINEDPSVHTADEGITAPAVVYSQLPTTYTAPVVAGLHGASRPGDPTVMLLSWDHAAGADYYIVEQSQDGTDWTRVSEPRAASYTGLALYGAATIVRIAAVGLTKGPWVTWYYGSSSDYMWTSDATLMWDASSTTAMWRF